MNRQLHIDNHTLIEECRRGDREALNLFYLRFAPRMLSVVRRYVPDLTDAEDILHDGFIIAYTRLDSLRDPDRVDYWLATIMKNLSLQFLQSQDVATMLHEIPEVADAPGMEEIIDMATLEMLIRKLPSGYQKVFRLAVLEGKSHKEIGKLLGIAPNSSSSQLFHAKMMMRRLIIDYRKQTGMFGLAVLLVTSGFLLRYADRHLSLPPLHLPMEEALISKAGMPLKAVELSEATPTHSMPSASRKYTPQIAQLPHPADSETHTQPLQGIPQLSEELSDSEDSSQEPDFTQEQFKDNSTIVTAPEAVTKNPVSVGGGPVRRKIARGWSVALSGNPGLMCFNTDNSDDYFQDIPADPDNPFENPDNPDNPDASDKEDATRGRSPMHPMASPRSGSTPSFSQYAGTSHTNYLPVSFALSVKKELTPSVGLEVGLTYTYLHSTFEFAGAQSHCHWHYLGIPLRLNIRTISRDRLKLYAAIGGAIDIPLYSVANARAFTGSFSLAVGRFNSPVAWSVSATYGAAVKLTDKFELFLEPTLQFHFPHHYTVPNVWTDNQWGFSLPIGFRFSW